MAILSFRKQIKNAIIGCDLKLSREDTDKLTEQIDILLDPVIKGSIYNRIADVILSVEQFRIQELRKKLL